MKSMFVSSGSNSVFNNDHKYDLNNFHTDLKSLDPYINSCPSYPENGDIVILMTDLVEVSQISYQQLKVVANTL